MTRVVGGQKLLDARAKEVLRRQLRQMAAFCGVEVLTYCIMNNHFHVLVRVPQDTRITDTELLRRYTVRYGREKGKAAAAAIAFEQGGESAVALRQQLLDRMGDVSVFMKELKQRFSIWFNKTHGRYGTLWAERFKSVLVENTPLALKTIAAYIDLNPVRAGLCDDPKDYRWCGYAEATGGVNEARAGLIRTLEAENRAQAATEYRQILFGIGHQSKAGQMCIKPEKVRRVLAQGGKLSMPEILRCRVRYFTDGAVIGTAGYVKNWIGASRERSQPKRRKSGPHPMIGCDWHGLTTLRALRSSVFG